ncbi:OLC1v1028628C1 [Oldenlandia corymbosa var. corymbosa]|uniref:OLC1v1028628C1 n=1 Tax=Oldenlandia corymbosa var. corymbosa TaxID=529605 RepID=A0AAV1CC67_OLDCO|nr:OLC1v1028628C1 [Oldenlandia corymbosa var. corymbosa]
MKMRSKGKVHPSPTSSPSSPSPDSLSVLKLLPAAILALISVLSLEDREVLAYLITRSLKSTNPPSFFQPEKTPSKKINHTHLKKSSITGTNTASGGRTNAHSNGGSKTPLFDCECFDCYTSFWFRWDSSPNRELISHAIEAFEENLNLGEQSKKGGKNRKKDKSGRRGLEKKLDFSDPEVFGCGSSGSSPAAVAPVEEISSLVLGKVDIENGIALPPPLSPEKDEGSGHGAGSGRELVNTVVDSPELAVVKDGGETAAATVTAAADNHKGLARKVLPDVMGLLNSRLWNLWSPNV